MGYCVFFIHKTQLYNKSTKKQNFFQTTKKKFKMVRRDECEFSHFVIHPGHGRRYVPWSRTYRRLHKKHQDDAKTKRRRTKVSRAPRAIVGLDLPTLQETRAKNKKVDRSAKGAAVRAEVAARKAAKK